MREPSHLAPNHPHIHALISRSTDNLRTLWSQTPASFAQFPSQLAQETFRHSLAQFDTAPPPPGGGVRSCGLESLEMLARWLSPETQRIVERQRVRVANPARCCQLIAHSFVRGTRYAGMSAFARGCVKTRR